MKNKKPNKPEKDPVQQFQKANRNTGCCLLSLILSCVATTAACYTGIQWLVTVCFAAIIVCVIALAVWSAITDHRNPSSWTPCG